MKKSTIIKLLQESLEKRGDEEVSVFVEELNIEKEIIMITHEKDYASILIP